MNLTALPHDVSSCVPLVGFAVATLVTTGWSAYALRRSNQACRKHAYANEQLRATIRALQDEHAFACEAAEREVAQAEFAGRQNALHDIQLTLGLPIQALRNFVVTSSGSEKNGDAADAQLTLPAPARCALDILAQSAADAFGSPIDASDAIAMETRSTDLREVIDGAVVLLGDAAAQKQVRLLLCIDRSVAAYVLADRVRIGRVIFGLLSYVIESADSGTVTLSARAESLNSGTQRIVFGINGPASAIGFGSRIAHRTLAALAEQPDFERHRTLAQCRALARRMGGDLTVMQGHGIGVCVAFHAPFAVERHELSIDKAERRCAIVEIEGYEERLALYEMLKKLGISLLPVDATSSARIDYRFTGSPHAPSSARDAKRTIVVTRDAIPGGLRNASGYDELSINPLSWCALRRVCSVHRSRPTVPTPPLPPDRRTSATLRPIILIVDDNDINRMVLAHQVDRLGFRHVTASSAEDALTVLAREPVDMLITDLQMPAMSGIELAEWVRAMSVDTLNTIPVILMTADPHARATAEARPHLFDAVLEKSPHIDALAACLARFFLEADTNHVASKPTRLEAFDFTQLDALSEEGVDLDALVRDWRRCMHDDLAILATCDEEHSLSGQRAVLHRLAGAVGLIGERSLMEQLARASTYDMPVDIHERRDLIRRLQTLTTEFAAAVAQRGFGKKTG